MYIALDHLMEAHLYNFYGIFILLYTFPDIFLGRNIINTFLSRIPVFSFLQSYLWLSFVYINHIIEETA